MDNLSNLKTLCKSCHDAVHHKKAMAPTHRSNARSSDQEVNPAVGRAMLVVIVVVYMAVAAYALSSGLSLFEAFIAPFVLLAVLGWLFGS